MSATNPPLLYVPDASALELSYGQRNRKERFQRTVTLLSYWLHGHDEQEIAEMVGTSPEDVGHEIQRALNAIERRRMPQAPRAEKPKDIDQMPEAVCDRCEALIPAGEYRVVALAVSRDRQMNEDNFLDQDIFTPDTRTFCNKCVMDVDEFVIANRFKCEAELMAKLAHAAPTPGEDALDTWRQVKLNEDITSSTGAPPVDVVARSMESVRRETLKNFLGDWTRSRGKMPPRMRQAAMLYAEGKSQSEIARELGIDQATVSRMLTGALKSANAAR